MADTYNASPRKHHNLLERHPRRQRWGAVYLCACIAALFWSPAFANNDINPLGLDSIAPSPTTQFALASSLEQERHPIRDKYMFRFEFDNDILSGQDDGFTGGLSLQLHSPFYDSWEDLFPGWIGHLPTFGDDGIGGRAVRWSLGLSQIMITPRKLTIAEPQPNDLPWVGILGVHGALSSYDNYRLSAIQLYLGCMGPCSQAENVQRFLHEDLGLGDPPAGWSNQLDTEILGNLNLAWRHKLWVPPDSAYTAGGWTSDFAIGGQLGIGNLATFAQAHIEGRFGRGLPTGFTHIPDLPGMSITLDPIYIPQDELPEDFPKWHGYASVVLRATYFERLAPSEGGSTENGGFHPGMDPNYGHPDLLIGLHMVRAPLSLHLTYCLDVYGPSKKTYENHAQWANFSLEYRF